MHQLLRTSEDETKGMASMKWDDFCKLMREMGFGYDPSAAGSSVRFDPPDPRDVPIFFHKRLTSGSDTIYPIMLFEFGKKLKKNYGWCEADLLPVGSPPKNIKAGPASSKPTPAAQGTTTLSAETDFLGRFFFESSSSAPHLRSPKVAVEKVDNVLPTPITIKSVENKETAAADSPEVGDEPSPATAPAACPKSPKATVKEVHDVVATVTTSEITENNKEPAVPNSPDAGEELTPPPGAGEEVNDVVPTTTALQSTENRDLVPADSEASKGPSSVPVPAPSLATEAVPSSRLSPI
ncbi:hypothetical protein MSAN_00055900 [Mycena sanguinolenta]|uniref:Uncharacterized protein n=1 Tax=Mycena sanguinolenta TaxID=230812 RepID=A0A8H7DI88_9AGAR|nr:hypothetical protein MSAN_00055900 [Mycena sanguinolenta]